MSMQYPDVQFPEHSAKLVTEHGSTVALISMGQAMTPRTVVIMHNRCFFLQSMATTTPFVHTYKEILAFVVSAKTTRNGEPCLGVTPEEMSSLVDPHHHTWTPIHDELTGKLTCYMCECGSFKDLGYINHGKD